MTERISKKLLVVLALTVVVAGVGARTLLTASDATAESGFDGTDPFPLSDVSVDDADPVLLTPSPNPRNPFVRASEPRDGAEAVDETAVDGTTVGVEPDTEANESAEAGASGNDAGADAVDEVPIESGRLPDPPLGEGER